MRSPRLGKTGMTARWYVELVTPAKDAYQAHAAVTSPSQPPALTVFGDCAKSATHSTMKVADSVTNTARIAPVVRMAATVMYTVNTAHTSRNSPLAWCAVDAGSP